MTFWVAGAVIVGSVGSSLIASNAAGKAADAQANAADKAADIGDRQYDLTRADNLRIYDQQREDQLKQYDQIRNDQLMQIERTRLDNAPHREVGLRALYQLDNASGPGGEFGPAGGYQRKEFEVDPGYQFRVSEGQKGIQRAASARGGMYSGATLKALARFNSDLGSQEYGAYDTRERNNENQFNANRDFRRNNLASLAGVGQTATRDVAQAGANATNAIGQAGQNAYGNIGQASQNAYGNIGSAGMTNANIGAQSALNAGEARASGYVGRSNAIGSGISNIYNSYQQQQYMGGGSQPYGGFSIADLFRPQAGSSSFVGPVQ